MLIGSLKQGEAERFGLHPVIAKAIDYLMETDFSQMDNGKHTIDGDSMYVNVMELTTKAVAEATAEKHQRYIDVHYLLEGQESIGWTFHREEMIPSQAYDEDQDYALYQEVVNEQFIDLAPGMYAVLYPNEIHRPGLCEAAPAAIRKAVVKIDKALLE